MNIKNHISTRLITVPTVVLLAFIFTFGFNFLKVFFPDHQVNTITATESVRLNSFQILTGKNYKVFPSRKQLIADPKHDLAKISASHPKPEVYASFSFSPNRTTGLSCLYCSSRNYNQNLPTRLPSARLSQYCTFLI